jgi:hypothetical protein
MVGPSTAHLCNQYTEGNTKEIKSESVVLFVPDNNEIRTYLLKSVKITHSVTILTCCLFSFV